MAFDSATQSMPLDRTTWPAALNGRSFDAPRPQQPSLSTSRTSHAAPAPGAPLNAARDTLQAAHALADAGRLAEAATIINAYLETHAPHADAFYLLGVLADANGESNVARAQYRKALYLDPQHTEALAHLATLLELEGDRAGARLLMQRATRAQGAPRD
jgi:chemotaxis protein methyltransferase WspC